MPGMHTRNPATAGPTDRGSARRRAAADLAAALPLLLLVAWATRSLFDLPPAYAWHTLALYVVLAALVLATVPPDLPGRGLGAANRVTLGRAMLALPIAALVAQPAIHHAGGHWWIIGLSTAAMVTDGFDGWAARRTGTATPFGARFDMELDAALVLALSLLVALSGRVGAWIVAAGALRYGFVAAGWLYPPLAAPLPPSRRRQTTCVVQGAALLVALGPIVPPPAARAAAFLGLAVLVYSFGVDVRWLLAARHEPATARTPAPDAPRERHRHQGGP